MAIMGYAKVDIVAIEKLLLAIYGSVDEDVVEYNPHPEIDGYWE